MHTQLLQQRERAALKTILGAASEDAVLREPILERGIEQHLPAGTAVFRQLERNRFVMRVEQHQEVFVAHRPAALVGFAQRPACQIHAEAAREVLAPLVVGHLAALGPQPRNVLYAQAAHRMSLVEVAPPEHRVRPAQRDDALREREQLALFVVQVPVDP